MNTKQKQQQKLYEIGKLFIKISDFSISDNSNFQNNVEKILKMEKK